MRKIDYKCFIERLEENFPEFFKKGWRVDTCEDFVLSQSIGVSGPYGVCVIQPKHLLNGHMPTILSAVDKHSFFIKKLEERNEHFRNGKFEVIGEYVKAKQKIEIKTKYGNCLVLPDNLLQNQKPTVESAINRTQYWVNYAQDRLGYDYDYSKVDYINDKTKVEIICPEHGSFWQTPYNHISGNQCPKCRPNSIVLEDWLKVQPQNPGIFYILRCWNDTEEFFKVGITAEKSVCKRYNSKSKMPYNFEVFYEYSNQDRNVIWSMEDKFKRQFNDNVYIPKSKFGGSMTECILNFNFIFDDEYFNKNLEIGNIVKYKNELYIITNKPKKWRDKLPYVEVWKKPENKSISIVQESVILQKLSNSSFDKGVEITRCIPKFYCYGIPPITEPPPLEIEDDFYEEENDSW